MFATVCLPDSEESSLVLQLPPDFLVPLTQVLSCCFKNTSEVLERFNLCVCHLKVHLQKSPR